MESAASTEGHALIFWREEERVSQQSQANEEWNEANQVYRVPMGERREEDHQSDTDSNIYKSP
jgi:hypothetical protein